MRFPAALLVAVGVATMAPTWAQAPSAETAPAEAASAPSAPSEPAPAPVASSSAKAPGQFNGLWCGSGPLRSYSLRLTQREKDVEGELARPGRTRTIEGRIEGKVLRTQATKVGALVLEHQGDALKITGGDGPIALARGQVFRRSDSGTCSG